eukprot:CAMPEP_0201591612 /NCGR_PEP_ID=MMETSP0190_2-20130828/189735_1 /ASSEMBLY_ACC=CAM_ASM_000263 /TAXON_ID=37353 /ORGANISM="Rosalina sp." /LENGTH=349 /DNA_ID=CAMNT_0048050013 /DNA_START=65 /DNA_END=1111 /DNA_ORIENTATION=+
MVFGLFHTNSYHSTNANLISSDSSVEREYSVEGELCDLQYAGDSALNDEFYLYITTSEGVSESTQIPQSTLVRGGEFKFTITASLGLDVRSATITTEALDAICIKKVSISVSPGDYSVGNYDNVEWISANCENTPTLTPCSNSVTFEFNYYFMNPSGLGTWEEVRESCQEAGGDLAEFENTPTLTPCSNSVTFEFNYYFMNPSGLGTWEEVRESCQEAGGDLAEFDDDTISGVYALCEEAVDDETGKSCYVGFNDFATLNDWVWLNGDAFDLYDYVAEDEFHVTAWDRCGCISMRYDEDTPLADCTCDFSYGLFGVCQSDSIDGDLSSSLRAPISPKGTSSMDETKPDI